MLPSINILWVLMQELHGWSWEKPCCHPSVTQACFTQGNRMDCFAAHVVHTGTWISIPPKEPKHYITVIAYILLPWRYLSCVADAGLAQEHFELTKSTWSCIQPFNLHPLGLSKVCFEDLQYRTLLGGFCRSQGRNHPTSSNLQLVQDLRR